MTFRFLRASSPVKLTPREQSTTRCGTSPSMPTSVRDALAPREGQAVAHCAEQCQVFPGEARATLDTQMQPQELAGPAPALSAQHGPEVEKWLVTDKDYPGPRPPRPTRRPRRGPSVPSKGCRHRRSDIRTGTPAYSARSVGTRGSSARAPPPPSPAGADRCAEAAAMVAPTDPYGGIAGGTIIFNMTAFSWSLARFVAC